MKRTPDTKLRNAIRGRAWRAKVCWYESMVGNNFWWYTASGGGGGGGAVIRVPSFRLTGTKLFSRGRQTFVADDDYASGPILVCRAHAGLSSKVSDFYGSKSAVAPKRATDEASSFQLNACRLPSKCDKTRRTERYAALWSRQSALA